MNLDIQLGDVAPPCPLRLDVVDLERREQAVRLFGVGRGSEPIDDLRGLEAAVREAGPVEMEGRVQGRVARARGDRVGRAGG